MMVLYYIVVLDRLGYLYKKYYDRKSHIVILLGLDRKLVLVLSVMFLSPKNRLESVRDESV